MLGDKRNKKQKLKDKLYNSVYKSVGKNKVSVLLEKEQTQLIEGEGE